MWWFIGISGVSDGYVGKQEWEGGSSWITRPMDGAIKLQQQAAGETYIKALYWAASALMKTPWIAPSTGTEKIFVCVIVWLGAMMFAVFLMGLWQIRYLRNYFKQKKVI